MTLPAGFDSIRGTARTLGCSHPTLIDAMDDGRIPESAILRAPGGQRIGLDVAAVRAAMAANTDPVQSARKGLLWTDDGARDVVPVEPEPAAAAAPVTAAADVVADPSYQEARAERERAQAAMAQLELAERLQQLVPVADVRRVAADTARKTRDALLAVPDRIAALLAAETDPARVHAVLSNELKQALHGIADRYSAGAP